MAQIEQQYSNPRRAIQRLLVVFVASAVAVFGLLFQQMWTHSRGFEVYAFEYWGPRAIGVVVVTTILGIAVVNQSWKVRSLFGVIAGLFVSFFYVWSQTERLLMAEAVSKRKIDRMRPFPS